MHDGRSPTGWRSGWQPVWLGVCLVGLATTAAVAAWQQQANQAREAQALDALAQTAVDQVATRLATYEYGLRGARGAIVTGGVDRIRRDDFARYHATRDIAREFPGTHGFGFIRRVPAEQRAAFERAAARDGWPGFAVRQLAPHAGPLDVIQYIEPQAPNQAAVGLDIASERHRREAAERAMRSGEATLTAPITLVQASGLPRRGFLLLLPIYRDGYAASTPEERVRALAGWAYAPLVIDEVVGGMLAAWPELRLAIADLAADGAGPPFYPGESVAAGPVPTHRSVRQVFGRDWAFTALAGPALARRLHLVSPAWVAVAGAVCSAVLASLAAAAVQARRRGLQAREAQQRLAALAAHSGDAMVNETLTGIVTDWNRAAERIFGWPADEAIGRPLVELIGNPDAARTTEDVLRLASQGQHLAAFDTVRLRRDGQPVDVAIAASPILDGAGRVVGVGKSLRDITRRRHLERELQALTSTLEAQVAERTRELEDARRDLRTLLDALPSMVGYWDCALTNRFANRAYSQWFGVDAAALPGRSMRELLGPALFALNRPHIDAVLRGEPQTFARSIPLPDGSGVRHSLAHYLPDMEQGRVRGFYVLVHDVSELTISRQALKAALDALATERQRLAENEAFLQRAERVAGVGGWHLDLPSKALRWTAQTRRIHEVPDDHVPTLDSGLAFFPPEVRPQLQALVDRACTHGEPWDLELPFTTATGRAIWVRAMGEAEWQTVDGIQVVVGLTGVIQDVTARRAAERALRGLHAAEEASAAKSAFLATMSHEMRTPLNAVIGFMHLLQRTALNAEQADLVARVHSAGQALMAVINDVLELSKIEAGQLHLHAEPFQLAPLLAQVADLVAPAVAAKRLGWSVEVDPQLPDRLLGDVNRLRQVLTNLLGNAVKFTDQGQVNLRVAQQGRSGRQVQLCIDVRDTGIGMDEATQAHLFEPFMQADASATRRFGGTGLGLSIVRRLLGLMGGHITVDSRLGEGSCFRLVLPLEAVEEAPADDPARAGLHNGRATGHAGRAGLGLAGVRVLVVDDSDANREVAQRLLAAEGAVVQSAASGAEAILALQQPAHGVAVVLMDLQMPDMDGHEATRRLRDHPASAAVPVVALTAGLMHHEQARARAAGMVDFVTKPIQPDRLVQVLRRTLAAHAISGLDLPGALRGLGGDRAVLARLLDQLLAEFGPAWSLAAGADAAPANAHSAAASSGLVEPATGWARTLHKLRGSAGAVGAWQVVDAATQAERLLAKLGGVAAPAPVRGAQAAALMQVGVALQRLATQAPTWRGWQWPPQQAAWEPDDGPRWTPAAQHQLVRLLQQQQLAAASWANQHAGGIRADWGDAAWQALSEALTRLDYAAAESLVTARVGAEAASV